MSALWRVASPPSVSPVLALRAERSRGYLTAKLRAFTDFVAEVYPMKGSWVGQRTPARDDELAPGPRLGQQPEQPTA